MCCAHSLSKQKIISAAMTLMTKEKPPKTNKQTKNNKLNQPTKQTKKK